MMPIKDVLAIQHLTPRPPVLVIDETTIRCSNDTGPICGCDEKYDFIKRYKPFFPGSLNPYLKKDVPEYEGVKVYWKHLQIGTFDNTFEKPMAIHASEIPEYIALPKEPKEEDLMHLSQPQYSECYLAEKQKQCRREHSEMCKCPPD